MVVNQLVILIPINLSFCLINWERSNASVCPEVTAEQRNSSLNDFYSNYSGGSVFDEVQDCCRPFGFRLKENEISARFLFANLSARHRLNTAELVSHFMAAAAETEHERPCGGLLRLLIHLNSISYKLYANEIPLLISFKATKTRLRRRLRRPRLWSHERNYRVSHEPRAASSKRRQRKGIEWNWLLYSWTIQQQ